MKRSIVVFGVLVAFLFAAFGAYAVENNTWGRIKASFVENPEKAAGDLQWLTYEASPRLAKKVPDGWYKEKLIGPRGGQIVVGNVEEIQVKLVFPRGALEEPELICLSVPEEGLVMVGVGGGQGGGGIILEPSPLDFELPVELVIRSKSIEPPPEDGSVYLLYWDEGGGEWMPTEEEVDVKVYGRIVEFTVDIWHFSRYALARGR